MSGRVTGSRETQFFFGPDVIMVVDGRWNRSAVGAGANCAQTTVISNEYVCSAPVTNTGVLPFRVPISGEAFSLAVGALNCGGSCVVEWSYRWVNESAAGMAGSSARDASSMLAHRRSATFPTP